MAQNNVIPFPVGQGFASGMGSPPAAQPEPVQAGAPVPQAPALEQLQARLDATLTQARSATLQLVSRAVPGTVEQGLFNQFGILQNTLAQLGARAQSADSAEALAAIGQDLQGVEKATNEYVAAVEQALANAPELQVPRRNLKLWLLGGGVGLAAVGGLAWLYFRKPARRRKFAGLFSGGASAGAVATTQKPKPRRVRGARKKK